MLWVLGYLIIAAVTMGFLYTIDPFKDEPELADRENRLAAYTFLSAIWVVVFFVAIGMLLAAPFAKK